MTRYTLFHKMPVLVLIILFAIYLMRVSLNMAAADTNSPDAAGYRYPLDNFKVAIHNVTASVGAVSKYTTRTVSGGLQSVARAPGQVVNFASSVADVPAFVQPAAVEHRPVPVITPVHFSQVQTVPAPPNQPAVAASPAPNPTPAPAPPVSPVIATASATIQAPTSNLYAWGNCTWWAAIRRSEIGDAVPNSWGNAASWAWRAIADGYAVDHHPTPGAIMQTARLAGGLGHVAFVESVAPDGAWRISEMNVIGLGRIDYVTEPASAVVYYNFIHDRQ